MDTLELATSGLPIPNIEATDYHVNKETADNLTEISNNSTNMMSSDEEDSVKVVKKRRKCFTNSSSDDECVNSKINLVSTGSNNSSNNEDSDIPIVKQSERKSRIKNNRNSDSSLSHDDEVIQRKKVILSKRDRKKKLHDKFIKLKSKESKKSNLSTNCLEDNISDEEISCLQIKQKVKEDTTSITLSVCDPDESDEKDTTEIKKIIGSKSKFTKSKPINMSAKEAMANMQKIKSESNRMLREKDVTLPYHRPKALSLKDIMSRRRPAVTSDGKTLPIKMNEEQLKHYAMLLEERQKEMIELCKSDTDDENSEAQEKEIDNDSSNTINKVEDEMNIEENDDTVHKISIEDLTDANDMSFDQITNVSMTLNNKSIINVEAATSTEATVEKMSLVEDTIESETYVNNSKIDKTESNINISDSSHNNIETINSEFKIDKEMTCSSKTAQNVLGNNNTDNIPKNKPFEIKEKCEIVHDNNTEESQVIKLHYDSEISNLTEDNKNEPAKTNEIDEFSDTELDYDDLDAFIENAEIIKDGGKENNINTKPTLTGAPGMFISLDDDEPIVKPSGIELLKQRFTYFANLQNQEDMEKDREKRFKPGTQHIKLKQQLEEEIAEQRSLEWLKRLEEEKILKSEQNAILGDDSMEDIDKIESKLEGLEKEDTEQDKSESDDDDDDLIENDVDMTDKPQKLNPMIDNEAEESDDNEAENNGCENDDDTEGAGANDGDDNVNDDDGEDSESSDSSESEDELEKIKPKKGRILKAFEDSDNEDADVTKNETVDETVKEVDVEKNSAVETLIEDKISQDDELQLAQANKSISEDLFPSQDSVHVVTLNKQSEGLTSGELGTFSILNTNTSKTEDEKPDKDSLDDIPVIYETQPDEANFDEIAGMCSGSFSQNIVMPTQKSQLTPSLEIGDDVVALCTGKFYDNQFVSQTQLIDKGLRETSSLNTESLQSPLVLNTENTQCSDINTKDADNNTNNIESNTNNTDNVTKKIEENALLKSILDELDEPEFDKPKQYKYFTQSSENVKKKLVIDSDDDTNVDVGDKIVKKKKKRKLETRALQISDDEEEDMQTDNEEYSSDVDDGDENVEKLYEYDSEENEVEVQMKPKKKKRMGDFFENEAELTSEDEWAGSGDEDEAGLDRMEREEGDDDVFHQGKLQRELGQIHMREVLDQDKREVRIIQEFLFEDADLGDGHRQRKFRWKNIDGEDESGAVVDEFGDTQEEEFESEELWRKQRHEREMFLRKIQQENGEEDLNTSINRTSIIKANLSLRTMSNLIAESKEGPIEKEITAVPEKKPAKDIPSPKKAFAIFKQNYHGSLLTRGRGALARLAALATPLVVDDDAPKVLASSRGNFVFTARNNDEPKVKKRKAETSVSTPQLIKKLKTEEYKKTLFDRLRE